jgi:hypothetical protein
VTLTWFICPSSTWSRPLCRGMVIHSSHCTPPMRLPRTSSSRLIYHPLQSYACKVHGTNARSDHWVDSSQLAPRAQKLISSCGQSPVLQKFPHLGRTRASYRHRYSMYERIRGLENTWAATARSFGRSLRHGSDHFITAQWALGGRVCGSRETGRRSVSFAKSWFNWTDCWETYGLVVRTRYERIVGNSE